MEKARVQMHSGKHCKPLRVLAKACGRGAGQRTYQEKPPARHACLKAGGIKVAKLALVSQEDLQMGVPQCFPFRQKLTLSCCQRLRHRNPNLPVCVARSCTQRWPPCPCILTHCWTGVWSIASLSILHMSSTVAAGQWHEYAQTGRGLHLSVFSCRQLLIHLCRWVGTQAIKVLSIVGAVGARVIVSQMI